MAIKSSSFDWSNGSLVDVNLTIWSPLPIDSWGRIVLVFFLDGDDMRVDVTINASELASPDVELKWNRVEFDFLIDAGAVVEYIDAGDGGCEPVDDFLIDLIITMARIIETMDTSTIAIANIINDRAWTVEEKKKRKEKRRSGGQKRKERGKEMDEKKMNSC